MGAAHGAAAHRHRREVAVGLAALRRGHEKTRRGLEGIEIKFRGASCLWLNHDLHAIDAMLVYFHTVRKQMEPPNREVLLALDLPREVRARDRRFLEFYRRASVDQQR